jgi:DNA-binding transcriptional LysR family regulator
LIRSFVAVGEMGSLSAAARQLRSSQPTVGRHVDDLEKALGVKLFLRGRRGYELTEAGSALMARGQAASDAMAALSRQAAGREARMSGSVRISASEMVSAFVLPKIMAQLAVEEPGIEVELVPSDRVENLLRRDADIAIRMVRPAQQELVAKKIADIPLQLCAARSYLERRGWPQSPQDLSQHDMIGFDRSDQIIKGFAAIGLNIPRSAFRIRTDHQIVYWQAVRAGNGIGVTQAPLIALDPDVEPLLPELELPFLPTWLAMHRDVRGSARIRRVADVLEKGLRSYIAG